ncbi:MAG TPA: phage protein Gp27 family protein [Caulobacteraceae bacterium]|nr:phage protein Gp27 family protein [Caulobacteraceae bacterium]
MPARSAVERLPDAVRTTLEGWLGEFKKGRLSLNDVMTRLEAQMSMAGLDPEDGPSRSAVHRHAEKFSKIAERVKRSEQFASALAQEVGPQISDGKGLQVLCQAFQSLAYDMIGNLDDGESLDPEGLMLFAKSLQAVAGAQKSDADRALKIAEQTRKNAAVAAIKEAKAQGLTEDKVKAIEKAVLGIET